MSAVEVIRSSRLELVSMSPAVMLALLAGDREGAARGLGAAIPEWWPDGIDTRFLAMRLDDMARDPLAQPWLLRGIVRRAGGATLIGHVGFHGPPRAGGRVSLPSVEIGYAVFPRFRGQGYAAEAAEALMDWARATHAIRRFVASVAPDNEPSLAIVRRLGFAQIGEQWDDKDGLELVFERVGANA